MVDGESAKDLPTIQETISDKAAHAVLTALRISRGKAIVHVDNLSQGEIVSRLPGGFHRSTVEELIARQSRLPREAQGWVVTGYSEKIIGESIERENLLQSIIRAQATMHPNYHHLQLLVLSDSLPAINIFDASLPWYNGPFAGDESVWTISQNDQAVSLTRHALDEQIEVVGEHNKPQRTVKWVSGEQRIF